MGVSAQLCMWGLQKNIEPPILSLPLFSGIFLPLGRTEWLGPFTLYMRDVDVLEFNVTVPVEALRDCFGKTNVIEWVISISIPVISAKQSMPFSLIARSGPY